MIKSIAQIAESYIGKTEKAGNSGFNDAEFEQRMRLVGWQKGQSWCAYFTELVWKEFYAGNPKILPVLDKLFSPAATATYANFAGSKLFKVSSTVPKVGAVAIWRYGSGWQGHAGIVVGIDLKKGYFISVEGNTNDKGGREGYIVASKPRKLEQPYSASGLNLVGFIYPV